MKNEIAIILLLFLLNITAEVFAANKTIKLVPDSLYPPFTYVKGSDPEKISFKETIKLEKTSYNKLGDFSESIHFSGYAIDIIISIYQTEGYEIELYNYKYPWARSLKNVETSEIDGIFPLVWNKNREKIFHFSSEWLNIDKAVIYVPSNKNIPWKSDFSTLRGLSIGVIRGWSYGDKWNSAIKKGIFKIIKADNDKQNFKMLGLGRVDGVAGWIYSTRYFLKVNKLSTQYKSLVPFETVPMFLGISKTNPRASEFMEAFENGFKKIEKNNILKAINEKWDMRH